MTGSIQNIVQHLFHQPSLQSVTVEEVQRVAEQHPSFAVAQYLLLKKMQETAHPGFTDQLQKTTLYFHNPLWLSFLLQQEPETVEAFNAFTVAGAGDSADENAGEQASPVAEASTVITEQVTETVEAGHHSAEADEAGMPAPLTGELPAMEAPAMQHQPAGESETQEERKNGQPEEDTRHAAEGESRQAQHPELPVIIETPFAKSDSLFEPYHTIDYFASQGIKLERVDTNPQDKLGRQLKSFTEWLRSMKKLPQATIEEELAKQDESEVLTAAAHSIEKKEVLTETMAEVYEKQGLTEKAAEVYRKLSLLNPSKTAYFAAKIEALNQQ